MNSLCSFRGGQLASLFLLAGLAGAQAITEFTTGMTSGTLFYCITAGPNGNVWFTESTGNRIGRVAVPPAPPALVGAILRRTHGAAGTFDLPLVLAPAPVN